MNDVNIKEVDSHKHLGLWFQSNGRWDTHIQQLVKKTSPMINCLRSLKYKLNRNCLEKLYKSFILPIFDYCDFIWDNCTQEQGLTLEKLHLDALRTISGAVRGTSHEKLYNETGMPSLAERRNLHKLCIFYKMINGSTPQYLSNLVPPKVSEKNKIQST